MISELILFSVSLLPALLIGIFVYVRDKNKESSSLLAKLFFGGIGACFLTLITTVVLHTVIPFFSADTNTLNSLELVIYVFIGVALIEEACKWIMAYKISYNDLEFDEYYDMIVYCIFVALGFACFENLFYVYGSGIEIGLIRAISAVPSHACDGFLMGYFLGLAKIYDIRNQKKEKTKYLILSLLIPVVAHGIYDYCLFNGETLFMIIFYVFAIGLFIFTTAKIIKISRNQC